MFFGAFLFFAGCLFMHYISRDTQEPETIEVIKYVEVDKKKKSILDDDENEKEKGFFNRNKLYRL
jgi:preprotein translocase subunit SecG